MWVDPLEHSSWFLMGVGEHCWFITKTIRKQINIKCRFSSNIKSVVICTLTSITFSRQQPHSQCVSGSHCDELTTYTVKTRTHMFHRCGSFGTQRK